MKKEKIIIVGVGEIAEIAADYFMNDSCYEVKGFSAERSYLEKKHLNMELCHLPIVFIEDLYNQYPPTEYKVFIALGYDKMNHGRAAFYHKLEKMGYEFVSYVSSRAFVGSDVKIGKNCFVLENNVLQRNVIIEDDVTLWSGNHIGHRSIIKAHTFLSSHVAISGYCTIGKYCFMGINSCTADHVSIADHCFIGGGVAIMKDTAEGELYRVNTASPERLSTQVVFGIEDEGK